MVHYIRDYINFLIDELWSGEILKLSTVLPVRDENETEEIQI